MMTSTPHIHRDDEGDKIGMWIFIFTELLLFGGLFICYSVYRYLHPDEFRLASMQLSISVGFLNTVVLLISSMTAAMSITAIKTKNKSFCILLLLATLLLAGFFMINKYFEWSGKISQGLYLGSPILHEASRGEILYFALYYAMTGLHALHIIIGMALIVYAVYMIFKDKLVHDDNVLLENVGLYWHLVDLIWIFLFPLFYLIH
ncbi:MAG: cytochrome c oxidase subunit 3 [Marinifilaceae bacterium]|nr:cytochrome c oxidase subunit 3 [Marinifilaceae bacterium]